MRARSTMLLFVTLVSSYSALGSGPPKSLDLRARCQKMLDQQSAILNSAKGLYKRIQANPDKKPLPLDQADSKKLMDKQEAVIGEIGRVIKELKADGADAAFPEVFEQLLTDMKAVQTRLELTDVGPTTQELMSDIAETLKEMASALRK